MTMSSLKVMELHIFLLFSNTIEDKSAVTLGNFSQNLFRKFVAILVVHYEMSCT